MLWRSGVVLLALVLAGCADHRMATPQPIAARDIADVLVEIKRQLQVYAIRVATLAPGRLSSETDPSAPPRAFNCGNGDIRFDVRKIRLALLTKTSASAKLSAAGTLGVSPVSVGVGAGYGAEGSQELVVFLFPQKTKPRLSEVDTAAAAPIAAQLLALRDAMIVAAQAPGPCWHTNTPQRPASEAGTYKLGLQVTVSVDGKIGVTLAPVTLGASGEVKSTTGNEMTVTFEQPVSGPGDSESSYIVR